MAYEGPERRVSGIRFNSEIGLGQAINAIVLLCGLAMGAQAYFSKTTTTGEEVKTLKADVAAQFASQKADAVSQYTALQLSMNDQFKGLRLDMANLPDLRAEIVQLERRTDQGDNRAGAQSDRMSKLETLVIQLGAKLDNLTRGAGSH